jgi:hypothetical protein
MNWMKSIFGSYYLTLATAPFLSDINTSVPSASLIHPMLFEASFKRSIMRVLGFKPSFGA